MKSNEQLKESILSATLQLFNEKGLKFTMDDIASLLGMSKKTIYTVFKDKESLFLAMVDCIFDSIKESEAQLMADESLSTKEKIRKILGVMPESYMDIDFRQLYMLRDKYPGTYKRVEERLESGWENTIALIEQGMEEGVIRKVKIPIVKMMLEAALEHFFARDILIQNNMSYVEGLNDVVDILMDGIVCEQGKKEEEHDR
jgi:AcrR family transcriptional regulator